MEDGRLSEAEVPMGGRVRFRLFCVRFWNEGVARGVAFEEGR